MKNIKIIFALLLISLAPAGNLFAQDTLTLDQYLAQVEANNPDIKSVNLAIKAAYGKTLELDMVYSPYFTADYNYLDDRSGAAFGSTFPIDKMKVNSWDISANEKFHTGSNLSLGYNYTDSEFTLLEPTALFEGSSPVSTFTGYEMKPFVRLQQSLLRDLNSGLTDAGIKKAKAATRAGQYLLIYKKQQVLMNAKAVYWDLTLAREVVAFRGTSLTRTGKLLKWNEDKVKLDLADKADLLAAQAGYKLRQLNLQLAQEDEVKASRSFNQFLGRSGDTVDFILEKLADKIAYYENLKTLTKTGTRADVLSAQAAYESSESADRETYYRSLPELTAFGQYTAHGLGLQYSDTWNQVANGDKPAYMLGLSFIVPLDYKTLNKVRQGYKNDFYSAKQTLAQAELAAANDWDQLVKDWSNVKSRLSLAQEIMEVQGQRVIQEQTRLERGRSTTFLVLNAENDLDDATLNVYRLVFEELMTQARAELYNTPAQSLEEK